MFFQILKSQQKHIKKQGNKAQSKEQIKTTKPDPKEMQIYEMPDEEFIITVEVIQWAKREHRQLN